MPRGSEVAVINTVVRKGFTEKVTLEQAPENIWRKSIQGRRTVSPRVPSRIVPDLCEEQHGSWYD